MMNKNRNSKNNLTLAVIALGSVGLFSGNLFAEAANTVTQSVKKESSVIIKPLLVMGYGYGGDDVGTLTYEGGKSQDVMGGSGFTIGGGVMLQPKENKFGAELTFAYKFDSAVATNADLTMDRFEVSFIPYYQVSDKLQIGLGMAKHSGVELTSEIDGGSEERVEFENATGFVGQASYKYSDDARISVRYTNIEYKTSLIRFNGSSYQEKVDGNNLGVYFNYYFSK